MPSAAKAVQRAEVSRSPRFLDAKTVVKRAQKKSTGHATVVRKPRPDGAAISDQQRRTYVEVAAYYIAERRGFTGAGQLEDWLEAEREVDRMLREGLLTI